MRTIEKRKNLIELINAIDEKSIDFLHGFFNLAGKGCDKRELLKFFSPDTDGKKVDTAFPVDYLRRIEEIYPDAINGDYVFDYNKNHFGELININNIIADRFLTFLWNLRYVNF
jgi:hypothetical protein